MSIEKNFIGDNVLEIKKYDSNNALISTKNIEYDLEVFVNNTRAHSFFYCEYNNIGKCIRMVSAYIKLLKEMG